MKRTRLGDMLVDEGMVPKEGIIEALREQQRTHRTLSDILIESQQVAEVDIARILVQEQQLPFLDLSGYTLHKELVSQFPADLLHRAGVLPLDKFGEQVAFACQEVPTGQVAEELRAHAPGGFFVFIALATEIRRLLGEHAPMSSDGTPWADSQNPSADGKWKNLFDSANDAVMADIGPGTEE
ncbi:MAG: hypothetical protein ACT4PV_07695 [Planctomycetaceae bacterium]